MTPTSPSRAPAATVDTIRHRLSAIGQDHVLTFFDALDAGAQAALLAQIESLHPESLPALIERYVTHPAKAQNAKPPEPAPHYPADPTSRDRPWDLPKYRKIGEDLIRAGKVAAFVVAGGQGSRLGFDGPKGKYPAGAVTRKPLFACLAEWIHAAARRGGSAIPWYVMTSPINHEETVAFFRDNRFFGMAEDDVMFFAQGVLPSIDMKTGKLLLAAKGEIATNPDGHGGSLRALHASGAIADMKRRGIEHISYFQIDNPLVRAIDPVFLGLHAAAPDSSSEMTTKIVRKTDPSEKVGIVCRTERGTEVIEYSDMPAELSTATNADGSLRFCAGSIAIHAMSVEFVNRLNAGGFALEYHRAEKKVPFVDLATGEVVHPSAPNAVKLETFVFDALPLCKRVVVYETDRIEEFAPIKNAEGNDSPATCSAIQTERAARWLARVGVEVPRTPDGSPDCVLEISPLTAFWPEDLRGAAVPKTIDRGQKIAL